MAEKGAFEIEERADDLVRKTVWSEVSIRCQRPSATQKKAFAHHSRLARPRISVKNMNLRFLAREKFPAEKVEKPKSIALEIMTSPARFFVL